METASLNRSKIISVIIPVYNAEKFVEACLKSLVNQTYQNWEALVIDDGSTDGSSIKIKPFLSDSRIKFYTKENSGVTETRWLGVEQSKGDIIMFLDADDIYVDNALKMIVDNFHDSTDILNFKAFNFFDEYSRPCPSNNIQISSVSSDKLLHQILIGKIMTGLPLCAYKSSLIKTNKNFFCNNLDIAEDTFFNLELITKEKLSVGILNQAIYGYRENPNSITRAVTAKRFNAVFKAIQYLRNYELSHKEINSQIKKGAAFRELLLWSTYMFNLPNPYYADKDMRSRMRLNYLKAFSSLYPYLKVYLLLDLFISKRLARMLIKRH